MKPISLLLAASLAANVALAVVFYLHDSTPAPSAAGSAAVSSGVDKSAAALRKALAQGDAAALEKAGLSADTARDLALGRALGRFAQRLRSARAANDDSRWWRNRPVGAKSREEELLSRRELSAALIAAFGDDFGFGGGDGREFAYLAPEKRAALQRVMQDYDEMIAKFSAGGVQLPSDRDKLRLLRAERERDIAALLTPDELTAYELRTSPSAATIRSRYGDAIESEEDFKKIFALQKAFDDKFPREALNGRVSPDLLRARSDADRQMQDDIRAALGDDKYAALRRASDSDLRTLDALASRLNLPATTTDNIVASRDSFSTESQRISADTSLTPQQRRAQIQELGTKAKTDLARALGAEGADAYAQRSTWLNFLQSGMAFSTTPPTGGLGALSLGGASPGVYPVIPAGANPAGTTARQVIVNGVSSGEPAAGGIFFAPAGGAVQGDNVHVMSFTATSSDSAAAPAPVPPPSAPAPAPKQ